MPGSTAVRWRVPEASVAAGFIAPPPPRSSPHPAASRTRHDRQRTLVAFQSTIDIAALRRKTGSRGDFFDGCAQCRGAQPQSLVASDPGRDHIGVCRGRQTEDATLEAAAG